MTRVRPRFIIALVAVLPLLAHSIWDYVEARRLRVRIEALKSRGEPVGPRDVQLSAAAAEADRLYRAASILASGFDLSTEPGRRHQLSTAIRDDAWTPDVRDEVRARLAQYSDAMALADRAAELPFEGFAPGTAYNYQTSHLWSLARICTLRATVRALDGDSDGAYASLYSAVRVRRALDGPYHFPGLKVVVERSQPSPAARARVMRAFDDIDVDNLPKQSLVRMRSLWLSGYDRNINRGMIGISRPWAAHRLTRMLDMFAVLVDAVGAPEPQRLAAIQRFDGFPGPSNVSREQSRASLERFVRSLLADADWLRCARRAVAGEPISCRL